MVSTVIVKYNKEKMVLRQPFNRRLRTHTGNQSQACVMDSLAHTGTANSMQRCLNGILILSLNSLLAAFNTINRGVLLEGLLALGVGGTV